MADKNTELILESQTELKILECLYRRSRASKLIANYFITVLRFSVNFGYATVNSN